MSSTENNTKIGMYLQEFNPGRLHYRFEKSFNYDDYRKPQDISFSDYRTHSKGNFTFNPSIENIRCPYCGKVDEYFNNEIKYRSYITNGQSKMFYTCKRCGREIDIW